MSKKLLSLVSLIVMASILLAACGGTPATTAAPEATKEATKVEATTVPEPTAIPGKPQVRWFVGLGTGSKPEQLAAEAVVVDDFNKAQSDIQLILEVAPYDSARDILSTEIASGNGPDIVGPLGWVGSNVYYGQWLDISSYMANFDSSGMDPALLAMYQTTTGTEGIPFAVYPSVTFYNTGIFDEVGLKYPPATYGAQYEMADGSMVEWNYTVVADIAKKLTLDVAGNDSTSASFDKTQISQYGYSPVWESRSPYYGAYWGASPFVTGTTGNYASAVPDAWKAAWQWYYDGIWGAQPYIPSGAVSGSAEYGSSNTFDSGKIGMSILPIWYLCCTSNVAKPELGGFQMGALPAALDGKVHGRVDADTFRVWKGTKVPDAAFTVLEYLVTTGVQKLVIGSKEMPAAYGALPARSGDQAPWLEAKKVQFPDVTQASWDVLFAGLAYPDVPSAEMWIPNMAEAWARFDTFDSLMNTTGGLDLPAEITKLEADLTAIYNK